MSGDATSRWPRSTCAAACSAVVPSTSTPSTSARTAAVASAVCQRIVPSSPASDATRPWASSASSSSAHSGGQGLSSSVLSRSWSSSGVVGAGSISVRTRSIASWVTRPISRIEVGRPRSERDRRSGAAIDGLAIVEERVGPGGEDLVGEERRLGGVDEVEAHLARLDLLPQLDEPGAVERLGEAVVDGLAREHGVGHLDGPGDVLLAGGGHREHDGEEVVALHPLERGRHLLAAPEAQHDQAPVEVPPPAALEDRLVEDGLLQRALDRARGEEAGHVGEREAVVRPEGDDDGVVVGAGLELEVEAGAELLAQRVAQRPVEAAAER